VYGSVRNATPFRLVVMAASLGGAAAYVPVLRALPDPLPVPVVLLQHRLPAHDRLAPLLTARAGRHVSELGHGTPLRPGAVHLAPAGAVTRIGADGQAIVEEFASPTRPLHPADDLFRSAGEAFGPGVIAVVFSGRLQDGAAGAREVKRRGGRVLVQDPVTSAHPSMPEAVLATGCVDLCLPPITIGAALSAFLTVPGAADLFRTRTPAWAHTGSA
jgi:two-component system chemotaxis response regulator CheB